MKCCYKILHLHTLWISNHIAKCFACQKNVTFTCLHSIMLMNLQKHIKKLMKTRWRKHIYRFKNKFRQFHFKKMLQLEIEKIDKNRSRRYRKIFISNSSYNFLLKNEYWLDVSIIRKSRYNNSILKKRSK